MSSAIEKDKSAIAGKPTQLLEANGKREIVAILRLALERPVFIGFMRSAVNDSHSLRFPSVRRCCRPFSGVFGVFHQLTGFES